MWDMIILVPIIALFYFPLRKTGVQTVGNPNSILVLMKKVDSIEQSKSNNPCTHLCTLYMIQTAVHTDENGCKISNLSSPSVSTASAKTGVQALGDQNSRLILMKTVDSEQSKISNQCTHLCANYPIQTRLHIDQNSAESGVAPAPHSTPIPTKR